MESEDYNEDEYESLNDIEKVLDSIGIKLRENAREWRDIDDILAEIGANWDNYDDVTQSALATAIAGTRQREIVLSLFENWDLVEKYTDIAENSFGTAAKKMEVYTDSIGAAQQRITAAIEQLALNISGSSVLKTLYGTVEFLIENIGALSATIGLLVVALNFSKVGNLLSTGMSKLASKATELSFTFDKVKQEAFGTINGSEDLKQARETYRQEQYIFL